VVLVTLLTTALEVLRVLLVWGLWKWVDGPEIWGQELVGVAEGIEGSSDEVTLGLGVTSGRCVNIMNTGEGDHLL